MACKGSAVRTRLAPLVGNVALARLLGNKSLPDSRFFVSICLKSGAVWADLAVIRMNFMAVLTVRMSDDRHSRLKELAASKGVSVNKTIEELITVALVKFDTHNRFKATARGSTVIDLEILDELDRLESQSKQLSVN
jgi:plasmid stability protein